MLRDASPAPIDIIHGDILRYNLEGKFSENKRKAWEDDCPDIHIIGNLPFNIATPLIVRWLRDISEKLVQFVFKFFVYLFFYHFFFVPGKMLGLMVGFQ